MHIYLASLTQLFEEGSNPENALAMRKYMRDQFEFLGIKSPQRKLLFKQFLAENGLPDLAELAAICRDLWALPAREYQYCGMDLLDKMQRKVTPEFVPLIEYMIVTKSWWDTVDLLASHAVGSMFTRFPGERDAQISRWRVSENMWLRRTTLLFQMLYKDKTDVDLLFALIEENQESTEFFIQKAIGWALRQYSKTDATAVLDFVNSHTLAPLSEREALKWLNRNQ